MNIWLVSFMDHDLGYFGHKTCTLEPLRDLPALLALHHGDVILVLQVEPELRAVAEIVGRAAPPCAVSNAASSIWTTSVYQGNLKVFFKSFTYSARITRDGVGPLHTTLAESPPPAQQRRLRSLIRTTEFARIANGGTV